MNPIIPNQREFKTNAKVPFNDLVSYIEETKGQEHFHQLLGFGDVLEYAMTPTDKITNGEKCIAIRTNCVTDIAHAAIEMNAVASQSKSEDPAYHFILSWPQHETPSTDLIFDAAEHAIKALGMHEHQYVIAIHGNTDHIHAHIAVNRVHPEIYKSHHIEWSHKTLSLAARQSELKHGWSHDNGLYIVQENEQGIKSIIFNPDHDHTQPGGKPSKQAAIPIWNDPESLDTYLKSIVARKLKHALPKLESWQALHVWLERYCITLDDTGGGGMRLHASSPETGEILNLPVSKGLRLLKRAELEARWGKFTDVVPFNYVVPDTSHLTHKQLTEGAREVINRYNNKGIPPDHIIRANSNAWNRTRGHAAEEGLGAHELSGGNMDVRHDVDVLLQGDASQRVGNQQRWSDNDLRHPGSGIASSGGEKTNSRREEMHRRAEGSRRRAEERRSQNSEIGVQICKNGSEESGREITRDNSKREERKQVRAAERLALRTRFAGYQNKVHQDNSGFIQALKELRAERSRALAKLRKETKAAKLALKKNHALSAPFRLQEVIRLDTEAVDRKLEIESLYQKKLHEIKLTRQPPKSWRIWLYEEANMGDQAALSALRGIVYQEGRDAKHKDKEPDEPNEPETDTEKAREKKFKRAMERLLKEEKQELAIRSANSYEMRPFQVDALLKSYRDMQWRVTRAGNVEYRNLGGFHLFTDRGNRLTFDRAKVSDDDIRLALVHAQQKFGNKLTLTGTDPVFAARMARLADDTGIVILNPELQPVIAQHRAERANPAAAPVISAPLTESALPCSSAQEQPENDRMEIPANKQIEIIEQTTPAIPLPTKEVSTEIEEIKTEKTKIPELEFEELSAEQRMRATVLAIDLDAAFDIPDLTDSKKTYSGPIIAVLVAVDVQSQMFAQHLGRHKYMLHPTAAPVDAKDKNIDVKYIDGKSVITLPTQEKNGRG